MKIYLNKNVYEAALDRIRFIFDHFDVVIVSFSGGKDSTVVFNLALQVAKEKGKLPLPVFFIDQEAEWEATIDYVRSVMYVPEVKPYWLQCELRISNTTSFEQQWLYCWKKGEVWLRGKDEISIKENVFGTIKFHDMFGAFTKYYFHDKTVAMLNGIRVEESPRRFLGMTSHEVKYGITWGRVNNKKLEHYAFSPIYDWSFSDVWAAIAKNDWKYNRIYDYMYQYGARRQNMRVSNLHHETAIHNLFFMQEIEPDNYAKLVNRLRGVNTASILNKDQFFVDELPFMFDSWKEYRDYLVEKLISNEEQKKIYLKWFKEYDTKWRKIYGDRGDKVLCNIVVSNDYHGTRYYNMIQNIRRFEYAKRNRKSTNK